MNIQAFLELALTLLVAAQPQNVPPELKQQAILTANTAISYAISSGLAPQTEKLASVPSGLPEVPQVTVASQSACAERMKTGIWGNCVDEAYGKTGYSYEF